MKDLNFEYQYREYLKKGELNSEIDLSGNLTIINNSNKNIDCVNETEKEGIGYDIIIVNSIILILILNCLWYAIREVEFVRDLQYINKK